MAREQRIEILAEMVANVLVVEVAVGDIVDIGDTVVLLESMKMEIPVMAEAAGTVTAVKVAAGDVVQEGDPLVELTGEAARTAEGAGFEPAADISASDRFQGGSDRPLRHPSVAASPRRHDRGRV